MQHKPPSGKSSPSRGAAIVHQATEWRQRIACGASHRTTDPARTQSHGVATANSHANFVSRKAAKAQKILIPLIDAIVR